ncbi:hypothetical protein ACHAXA_003034, partial [Cyclostephanos tholiformis]
DGGDGGEIDAASLGNNSVDSSFFNRVRSIDSNVAIMAFEYLVGNGKLSMEDADEAIRLAAGGGANANANDGAMDAAGHGPVGQSNGSSANVGVLDDNSVEKDLFAALERTNLLVMPVMVEEVDGGRTTNVTSARAASMYSRCGLEYDYPRILNGVLPPAIRVLGWCPVTSEFSARFSCRERTYRYFFPRRNLDLDLMACGLRYMMGKHDFRNLCKMNVEQVYNFERVLIRGKVVSPQVVHELESPTLVRDLLDVDANPAKPSYEMASEAPLVLHRCSYGNNLTFGRTVRNLWDATKVLERRWEGHAISAERARDELDSLRAETEVRWTDLMDFVERIADGRRGARGGRRGQRAGSGANDKADGGDVRSGLIRRRGGADTISWGSAVEVIEGALAGVHPHPPSGCGGHLPRGQTESSVHVPIMERSRGTTYEEKVRSILSSSGEGAGGGIAGGGDRVKSSKRKERYEENIIRKRKTAEEDKAFYDRMLRQGGSSSWQGKPSL